ncbi:pep-cterm sorting domain-containing protein [Anaeramoeba ignava]|uniref:Pep-cterm sorting domain-containing protein n=1 Tax=Anaeramoeba ignava TaxID=1746090 RepID=A0A9Q0R4C4_ANAIG|nr:pep-cterm sorting domain-containing protein [Anaeramoeba ignava]
MEIFLFENQENLLQLLEISIYFKLDLLKEIIQKKISNSINYSNFFQFLFQNRNLNSNEIEIKCFELINQNFSQIQNNENLFNLTKEEIIKFIQFKQEKKEIFQFDFFQFLNNWIEKRNQRLKGKKEKEKEKEKEKGIEKKRLFHSFFSLFDKDSISKQDFDKLKQFDFFPKSFLVDIQNKVIQDNQKEIEKKEKEIEEKWKKEVEDKEKENQQMKIEIEEKWKKEVENKEKEIEDKNKEIEDKNKEVEKMKEENEKMKPIFDQYQMEIELRKNFPQFSDSEIIKDIEYVNKLQEWINDNDFFSKMKKGFSAKRDGFDSQNWHKAVDGKGKTLVIIKTKDNFIFGGFTQVGFNGNTRNINDSNAFIFSLRNDKGDRIPAKFTYNGKVRAIYSYLSYGPVFGNGADFGINSDLQTGWSNFGCSYNLPNGIKEGTNEAKSYLAGSPNKWVVDELESYFI